MTEEALAAKLASYATHNAEDCPTSVLELPALKGVEPLNFSVDAGTSTEAMAAKARCSPLISAAPAPLPASGNFEHARPFR